MRTIRRPRSATRPFRRLDRGGGLRLAAVAVLAVLLVGACGGDDATASTATTKAATTTKAGAASGSATAKPKITASGAWVRSTAAAATNGAAYVTLEASADDQLLKVAVDPSVAKEAQVHETVSAGSGSMTTGAMGGPSTGMGTAASMGGEMQMREVSAIDLPAGRKVELKPGGYHIMLMGLVKPLKAGDKVELTLTFAKAEALKVTAEVRDN